MDDEDDYALGCWAGVLPLKLTALAPEPNGRLRPGTRVPAGLSDWSRGRQTGDS